MPDGNTMYPIIHKQKAYSYEDEVRLIYLLKPEFEWDFDWSKEEVTEGKYIKVDLEELISEIIVSPYSPQWFLDLIHEITGKYGLNKIINKSQFCLPKRPN